MPSSMETKKPKPKWEKEVCGCITANLPRAERIIIRCEKHRGKPAKKGNRDVCYFDADGILRSEAAEAEAEKVELPPTAGAYVYFAQLGDLIKIGISIDPERRARELNAILLGAFPGSVEVEKKVQREFADSHYRNEWYRADTDALERIKELLR
jgi:Meiotically Up-regulated Gene 113 (MUG113) protein